MSVHRPDKSPPIRENVARPEVDGELLTSTRDLLSAHFSFPVSFRVTVEHALRELAKTLEAGA